MLVSLRPILVAKGNAGVSSHIDELYLGFCGQLKKSNCKAAP